MANSRSRKSAPTRPGTPRDQRPKISGTPVSGPAVTADDPAEPSDGEATAKTTVTAKTAKKAAAPKVSPAVTSNGAKATPAKTASSSSGRRFGDGASSAGPRKGSPTKPKSGGGGRRGGKPAPAVRVGTPRPWGMIAATVAVLVFAAGAIGYAVYQADSNALPTSFKDIQGIQTAEYTPGQKHVTTDVTYTESPPVGGPHDLIWADCDGAVYDQQIRSENAVHALEHGAVWITYNPDQLSADDVSTLSQYVVNQNHILMSPFAGLSSPISLQSWNHQVFVDSVTDSRINQFIQLLRQNPAEYPEVNASCSQPTFLADPVLEGEQSRTPAGGPVTTDTPTPAP